MKYSDVVAENSVCEDFLASCEHAKSVSLLAAVDSLLQWDEQTMLPAAAGEFRAEQAATASSFAHAQRTQQEQGERLENFRIVRLLKWDPRLFGQRFDCFMKISRNSPVCQRRACQEIARTSIEVQQEWVLAVEASEWKRMIIHLEKMFSLKRELAAFQSPELDPYDALMDDYEPGARWRSVDRTFSSLRKALTPLVHGCFESTDRPPRHRLFRVYFTDSITQPRNLSINY